MRGRSARLLTYAAATKMARGKKAVKEVQWLKVFAADALFQRRPSNGMQGVWGLRAATGNGHWSAFREAKHAMVRRRDQRDPAQHDRTGKWGSIGAFVSKGAVRR